MSFLNSGEGRIHVKHKSKKSYGTGRKRKIKHKTYPSTISPFWFVIMISRIGGPSIGRWSLSPNPHILAWIGCCLIFNVTVLKKLYIYFLQQRNVKNKIFEMILQKEIEGEKNEIGRE